VAAALRCNSAPRAIDRLNGLGNEQSTQRTDSELLQRKNAMISASTACAKLSEELAGLNERLGSRSRETRPREGSVATAAA
jgi:hypothetical protein